MIACNANKLHVMKSLIENGDDILVKNNVRKTVLHFCLQIIMSDYFNITFVKNRMETIYCI